MKAAKEEILNGLRNLNVRCEDFEHSLEDSKRTFAKKTYYVETENFNITLELEEEVLWDAPDYSEPQNMEISNFTAINSHGEDYGDEFTDEEIIEAINY